jgi:pilus assembly protein CpaC
MVLVKVKEYSRVPAAKLWWLLLGLALVLGGAFPARATDLLERVKDQEIKQVLRLRVGHSKVLRTPFPITRISMADPEIADIILISDKEIYVNAQSPGVTNLSIWGKNRFSTATVTVEADVSLLKEKLHQVLPKEKIGVEAAGDSVVLTGEVSGPVAQSTALALAAPFAGGKKDKVVNLLHVGGVQQVMVEVRLAEINRNVADRMGINVVAFTKSGEFGVSQINGLASISNLIQSFGASAFTQGISPNITAIAGFPAAGALWTLFFDVLKQQGLGRVLAEPNLVTTSGQEATFLAGGEFPIPVPQSGVGGGSTITIEYKKFGVGLNFTPTVLDDGKISMRVAPEVSELDFSSGVAFTSLGFTVPGLKVRRMSTNVEVKDGQTFAIAGLLSDNNRAIINKFPVLGDLPILGPLFRSNSYQKNETELVVLVIPHLVKPMGPGVAKLPTDKYVEPTDFEKYLLGYLQGDPKRLNPPPSSSAPLPAGFGRQSVQ